MIVKFHESNYKMMKSRKFPWKNILKKALSKSSEVIKTHG